MSIYKELVQRKMYSEIAFPVRTFFINGKEYYLYTRSIFIPSSLAEWKLGVNCLHLNIKYVKI